MTQPEEQFETLRKLLKIKSQENPPPGFHDRLHNQIMARVKARSREQAAPTNPQSDWLSKLLGFFEFRPAMIATYSVSAIALGFCALAFINSLDPETPELQLGTNLRMPTPTAVLPTLPTHSLAGFQPVISYQNTNSVSPNGPPPGLFDGPQLRTLPAADRGPFR